MARVLDDILVVALEQAVAAPFCSMRLADSGARVIKLERAEGDFARDYDRVVHGESAHFVWLNRGKESIVVDIKSGEDARLIANMVAKADVFIQNLSPGAAARAGLGADSLRAKHPRLITCDISGYGEDGPWRKMKAYDFLIQCESGMTSITGGPAEPGRVGVSIADISCGMNAHSAILQALYEREKTGLGASVAISLFDGLAEWMTVPLLHFDYGGSAPVRLGMHHPTIAPYGAYSVGGGQVALAVQNEREWVSFCRDVLQLDQLATDLRFATNVLRCENRIVMDDIIAEVFRFLSIEVLIARLQKANLAYGAVNGVPELSRHEQLRRMVIGSPSGAVSMPAPPWRWRNQTDGLAGVSPALDAHGASIRLEFS